MKNYLSCLTLKATLWVLYVLPLKMSFTAARILGFLAWMFLSAQKRTAYKNLKAAFYNRKDIRELKKIIYRLYQHLGLSIAEIARFAKIDKAYIKKHIKIEGLEHAFGEKRKNKGIIFLTAHFGNWEFSSQVAGIAGFRTKVLARPQKVSLIDDILNRYRSVHGCTVVTKGANLKTVIRALRGKENLGMLADEDARRGLAVRFFGRTVLSPAGPMEIAYKTGSPVILSFLARAAGADHKLTMHKPYYITCRQDIQKHLQLYYEALGKAIEEYPWQWLWFQKRWRSSAQRNIIILSDNKAGHLKQSTAVALWLQEKLREKNIQVCLPYEENERFKIVRPAYRRRICPVILNIAVKSRIYKLLPEKLLELCLKKESFREISALPADYLISCGSSLGALNVILKFINTSKNIIVMKPAVNLKHFDLAVVPAHDRVKEAENIIVTEAAPNLVSRLLKREAADLPAGSFKKSRHTISLFFGGDARFLVYKDSFVEALIMKVKEIAEKNDFNLLVTTSRRTSVSNERILKDNLCNFNRCGLLVVANKNNPADSAAAMMAAADIIVVTFDSISMISEAASSKSRVIVISPEDAGNAKGFAKHKNMIKNLVDKGYILTSSVAGLDAAVLKCIKSEEKPPVLDEELKVKKALEKIL